MKKFAIFMISCALAGYCLADWSFNQSRKMTVGLVSTSAAFTNVSQGTLRAVGFDMSFASNVTTTVDVYRVRSGLTNLLVSTALVSSRYLYVTDLDSASLIPADFLLIKTSMTNSEASFILNMEEDR